MAAVRGLRDAGATVTDSDVLLWRGRTLLPPINLLSIIRIEIDLRHPGYVLFATAAPSEANFLLLNGERGNDAPRFVSG